MATKTTSIATWLLARACAHPRTLERIARSGTKVRLLLSPVRGVRVGQVASIEELPNVPTRMG
jgi:hypothetical protein